MFWMLDEKHTAAATTAGSGGAPCEIYQISKTSQQTHAVDVYKALGFGYSILSDTTREKSLKQNL